MYRDQTTFGLSSTGLDYIGLGGNAMNIHAYTNASGRYGSFGFVDLGGGYFQVKSFFYPKYCLSTSSGALTVMFTCNSGDPNQRFRVSTEIVVNALTSDQIVNTMQSQKQMAESGQTNGANYQALKNLLLGSLSMTKVFDNSYIVLANGSIYKPSLLDWANLVDGNANLDPNLKVFTKEAKLIGNIGELINFTQLVMAVGEDEKMFESDIQNGIIPGNDTLAFITGWATEKATTSFIITTACVPSAFTLTTAPCVIGAVTAGVSVGNATQTQTKFVFERVLTQGNVCASISLLKWGISFLPQSDQIALDAYLAVYGWVCN
ncbi:MAG: hypothetical protein HC932_00295 [Thermales bacterium]|nr:hypothetical protein [Thermales bacterium]